MAQSHTRSLPSSVRQVVSTTTGRQRSFEAAAGRQIHHGFDFGRVQIHHAAPLMIQRQGLDPTSNPAAGAIERARQLADQPPGQMSVYLCSKPLETSPIGTHTFLRVGGSAPGNPTYSLYAAWRSANCWQGEPLKDTPADKAAQADCIPTRITPSCLETQFAAYPIGRYCALGPNSNTFVGTMARNCGMSDPDPPGWNPGIDDSPPAAGTFTRASSPKSTLVSCPTANSCADAAPSGPEPAATYRVTPTGEPER